jgi:lipopolysaccharide export system protein LptA
MGRKSVIGECQSRAHVSISVRPSFDRIFHSPSFRLSRALRLFLGLTQTAATVNLVRHPNPPPFASGKPLPYTRLLTKNSPHHGDFALRNQDAARYARWAAYTAVLIALVVAGVYARRAIQAARARQSAPPPIPASVQQESAEFSYVGTDQGRQLFTIRASHATQYKDQNRALLQDVWITIYGHDGSRNDNIHTRECNYEPSSGNVVCEGDVQIDLASATPASGKPADKDLQVTTRNLSFNRESGDATTTAPVQFRFPQGSGHSDGMTYSSQKEIVRLAHNVQLDLAASEKSGGLPVTATGGSMEISRNDRLVVLDAPANVRQGGREISADKISIELDAEFRARHAIAQGHPQVASTDPRGKSTATAAQFDLFVNSDGWIERIVADGSAEGSREAPGSTDHFTAANVVLNMTPQHNLLREMTATGNVKATSRMGAESRAIETESLLATFGPGQRDGQQAIQTVSTLAPGTIETKSADETTTLHAKKFVAQFASTGRLDSLQGHGGATVTRKIGSAPPQVIKAAELAAKFSPDGEWQTLDETGDVHFQQADRQASADRANIVRSTELILLDGSPVLTDSMSRTTAKNVAINQKSGDIRATGGVLSTYFPSAQNSAMSLGSGPGHISAETLTGSTTSGHVTYLNHARLWQGDSVLEANQIEIWRDEKKLQATGSVVANFPQASPPSPAQPNSQPPAKPSPAKSATIAPGTPSGPTLWQIRAPTLTYWGDTGKAHLESGVTADSQQGSMQSRTLDVFLTPAAPPKPTSATPASAKPTGQQPPSEGRQLDHALALGGVTVRQGDRRGTADQAEYTASDGKFVLSGGRPTIIDASADTTTGHSLTFFVANDTILIDSQEGSRTLTKHRVEK